MVDNRLWVIEGVPGAGKTTTARHLADHLNATNLTARWWLEESKDHPVMPAILRKTSAEPDFDRRCLQAWDGFLTHETGNLVVEGAALQNAVRFMFANQRPEATIAAYWRAWEARAAPHLAGFLFLSVNDMTVHYEHVRQRRGPEWSAKLIAYVETTPIARSQEWRGLDGFAAFWGAYQDLCLRLVDNLSHGAIVAADLGYDDLPTTARTLATHGRRV